MPIYLVERYLAGIDREQLSALPERLAAAARQLRAGGVDVAYLDSTFLPEDEYCFCRFESPSAHATELANRIAGIPYARISAAVSLDPGAPGPDAP
ncbi:MAG TPA: nickel-binding protein [Solirubrobacteraceae bacterium]